MMKKVFKIGISIIGLVYLAIIIFVTGCLLFYNQYKVTQINDKTLIIIDDKSDKYEDGDLVVFTKNPNSEIVKGDEIFFYEVSHGTVSVKTGTVTKSEKITETETTFTINNNHEISSQNVIGKTMTANAYHNVGKILYVFESRFGFLLLVILPALLFFFYELYRFISELRRPAEDVKSENQVVSEPTQVVPEQPVVSEPTQVVPEQPVVSEPAPVVPEQPVVSEPTQVVPEQPVASKPTQVVPEQPVVSEPAPVVPEQPVASKPTPVEPEQPVVSEPTQVVPEQPKVETLSTEPVVTNTTETK